MAGRIYTAAMVGFVFGISERITSTNLMDRLGHGSRNGLKRE
jgi:hypothetical protein